MRNVLLIGAFVGVSASVPIVYQASPETFHRMFAPAPGGTSAGVTVTQPTSASKVAAPTGRKARVESDGKGHFNTELRMNGRRVDGMIDTGATYLAFNLSTARRLGIAPAASEFRYEVNTANGKTNAALVKVASVEIGRIRVENVEALVLEDKALKSTLVGMNVLKAIRKVEVRDGVMLLEQ